MDKSLPDEERNQAHVCFQLPKQQAVECSSRMASFSTSLQTQRPFPRHPPTRHMTGGLALPARWQAKWRGYPPEEAPGPRPGGNHIPPQQRQTSKRPDFRQVDEGLGTQSYPCAGKRSLGQFGLKNSHHHQTWNSKLRKSPCRPANRTLPAPLTAQGSLAQGRRYLRPPSKNEPKAIAIS